MANIYIPRSWRIPERDATPEQFFMNRRGFLAATAGGVAAAALTLGAHAEEAKEQKVPRNEKYKLDRPLTEAAVAASHNIFDELAADKESVAEAGKKFVTSPWKIHIGGLVPKELTFDVTELVKKFALEERLYRHRCVETWAMAVPWTGFPLAKLVEFLQPMAKAKYLRMVSFTDPDKAPNWYGSRRVFPYYEALSLAEATNELAFLATGIYGKPLPPQHGAPIRLVVPWKYGFKSIKSIVAFQFTEERPGTFWSELSPSRYNFLANVDPSTVKPWPQNEETMIGTGEKRQTLLYNGYGEQVASLYA